VSPAWVSNSSDFEKYGTPDREYLAILAADISVDDHLDCQSNHKYLEGSLLADIRKGISSNVELSELYTLVI
jgi:hypothetical protein